MDEPDPEEPEPDALVEDPEEDVPELLAAVEVLPASRLSVR